jgi:predicted neuraminidase
MQRHFICEFDPYGREPVLRRMPDGSLVCLFLSGGEKEPSNDNVVMICRSHDDGETWSAPEILFSHSHRAVWATELFTEGYIPFVFVHTYNAESWYRELQTFRSFTYDCGKTWTKPTSLPCGLNGVSMRQGIVMSSGEWLVPFYRQEIREGQFDWDENILTQPPNFVCGAAISADGGESFYRFGNLRNDEIALWEPSCVELEEGHIVMVMRGLRYLFVSESYDYGRTWSEPHESVIPNANTKPLLLRVRDSILLINNFVPRAAFEARTHLEIWVSNDMMRSWKKKLPVMPSEERWFYPHAFADEETQMLYVACENKTRHELIKIPFEELGI